MLISAQSQINNNAVLNINDINYLSSLSMNLPGESALSSISISSSENHDSNNVEGELSPVLVSTNAKSKKNQETYATKLHLVYSSNTNPMSAQEIVIKKKRVRNRRPVDSSSTIPVILQKTDIDIVEQNNHTKMPVTKSDADVKSENSLIGDRVAELFKCHYQRNFQSKRDNRPVMELKFYLNVLFDMYCAHDINFIEKIKQIAPEKILIFSTIKAKSRLVKYFEAIQLKLLGSGHKEGLIPLFELYGAIIIIKRLARATKSALNFEEAYLFFLKCAEYFEEQKAAFTPEKNRYF